MLGSTLSVIKFTQYVMRCLDEFEAQFDHDDTIGNKVINSPSSHSCSGQETGNDCQKSFCRSGIFLLISDIFSGIMILRHSPSMKNAITNRTRAR